MLFIVELSKLSKAWIIFLVAMRLWETPVPIPNTMVKTQAADGTALETVWESRWPPDLKKKKADPLPREQLYHRYRQG